MEPSTLCYTFVFIVLKPPSDISRTAVSSDAGGEKGTPILKLPFYLSRFAQTLQEMEIIPPFVFSTMLADIKYGVLYIVADVVPCDPEMKDKILVGLKTLKFIDQSRHHLDSFKRQISVLLSWSPGLLCSLSWS